MKVEKFIDRNIAELCTLYSATHGYSINLKRVVPDFIDGLKPVARRSLYIMFLKDQGRVFRKLATISGEVIGRVHPHGDVTCSDCIVGMSRSWTNTLPLVEGYGHWGCISNPEAAAPRYILARLSDYAYDCFFSDWKEAAVDMVMGYDDETKEPLYLPAKYPNVCINGTLGIGYAQSSMIPCFNFKEVVQATIKLIKNKNAEVVLVPDSPTGCYVIENDFKKLCDRGIGTYSMRCTYEIDDENNEIKVTSLPYQVTMDIVTEKIADIKEKNGFPELVAMHDYSGTEIDLRLKIRDDVNPYKFLRKLIDNVAGLERTYPVNITVTNDYKSYDLSIKGLLLEWIGYRREQVRVVVTNKRTGLLAEQRTNDVKIFLLTADNLSSTIRIFKEGKNRSEIEKALIIKYHDSEIRMDSLQAKTLSEMKMYELSQESYQKCIARREELLKELKEVLASSASIFTVEGSVLGS